MIIVYILGIVFGLYLMWLGTTFWMMDDEDYNRHRELILYPENDVLGNTVTTLYKDEDGNLKVRKRVSIGATKRLLNKVWNNE